MNDKDKGKNDNEIYQSLSTETREIWSKYNESFQFLETRKLRQVRQLVLLNNLQRGDENIASTLLLTLFNRIMSNLYDDKMQIKFTPAEELDQKTVASLNILAQHDYREMEKDKLDYDWVWDTLFFGRGYMETLRFDPKRKIMEPHVINPLVFGYDPFFEDPQEWRYYWKWITKSSVDINKLIKAKKITGVKSAQEIPSGVDPYLWEYKIRRDRAKMANPQANETYRGDVHQILEFFGYDAEGNKTVYWLDRDFSKILYKEKLDLKDGDDGKESKWPVVIKEAFREPHSSVVFSVADLLEDKHRARSVLLNLAFIAAKDKANPIYVYNPDKIENISQLFSRQISQHIPVNDIGAAIAPLNKDSAMDPSLQVFMQTLNQEANDPIGTGMSLNPGKKGKETATEAAITQQLNDLAQSLQSKVLQFGEKEFWGHWFARYKRYTKAGDIKVATIVGVKGMTFEKIDLGDIHTNYPPGVLVFSAKDAEYKELVERRDLMQMYPDFAQTLSPDGMRNFNKYVFFPKFLKDPQMMDIIIPKSIDEIKAEEENDAINDNSLPHVAETDNHEQHLPVHYMAKNTWAKWTHITWHEELLGQQKKQQMDAQQAQMQAGAGMAPGGAPGGQQMGGQSPMGQQPQQPGTGLTQAQPGQDKQSPLSAASSLRSTTQQSLQQNQPNYPNQKT